MLAGVLSGGGSSGYGVSATVLVRTDTVTASIGAHDDIASHGSQGLSVTASTSENVTTIAVGGSGAGSTGAAGSADVNVWTDTTTAFIGYGATVNASSLATGVNPNVLVQASDTSSLLGIGGALALGGDTGFGAGIDVGVITKNTQAYVAPSSVQAGGNVRVLANSSEAITSVAIAGAFKRASDEDVTCISLSTDGGRNWGPLTSLVSDVASSRSWLSPTCARHSPWIHA